MRFKSGIIKTCVFWGIVAIFLLGGHGQWTCRKCPVESGVRIHRGRLLCHHGGHGNVDREVCQRHERQRSSWDDRDRESQTCGEEGCFGIDFDKKNR